MMVVGRRDGHRVDVFALLEHLAIVFVLRHVRVLLVHLCGALVVDVAHGDNVLARDTRDVGPPFSAAADGSNVQFFVGRAAGSRSRLSRNPDSGAESRRLFHEFAPRRLSDHVCTLPRVWFRLPETQPSCAGRACDRNCWPADESETFARTSRSLRKSIKHNYLYRIDIPILLFRPC